MEVNIYVLDLEGEVHSKWTCGQVAFKNFIFLVGGACRQKHKPSFEELLMMRMGLVNLGISKYIA